MTNQNENVAEELVKKQEQEDLNQKAIFVIEKYPPPESDPFKYTLTEWEAYKKDPTDFIKQAPTLLPEFMAKGDAKDQEAALLMIPFVDKEQQIFFIKKGLKEGKTSAAKMIATGMILELHSFSDQLELVKEAFTESLDKTERKAVAEVVKKIFLASGEKDRGSLISTMEKLFADKYIVSGEVQELRAIYEKA